jgi:Ca2+/H+ antiporter, TMEM165/GDT1 family
VNPEKVIFGFFIVLALTLNFGFVVGEIDNPAHHHVYEFFAVVVVNLIATVLKFGDRSQMGAILLSTSLVADLQLFAAALVWGVAVHVLGIGFTPEVTTSVVSLAAGALLANVISVILLIIETVMLRR